MKKKRYKVWYKPTKPMSKTQKINWIKCWLQKFGDRDNETFYTEVEVGDITWSIFRQYDYDFEGNELNPYNWCKYGYKHMSNTSLEDRTDNELDGIISALKERQTIA